jgi:hypothetical protein
MNKIFIIMLFGMITAIAMSQTKVSGQIVDNKNRPVEFANIYIKGSIDGARSDSAGRFGFTTDKSGTVTILASCIGYDTYILTTDIANMVNMTIKLKAQAKEIEEVVVTAGSYMIKSASTLQQKNTVSLVTTAGSEGDLYKSIALLPGTQVAGIDGRLLVRGGSSRETQTYIDGMHVLSPYTASSSTFASRGRYSPFLFEGISFSLGGYSPEYSQSLSAILPLDTKDENKKSKTGISIMNVAVGGGGTKAWNKASSSFNLSFLDLTANNELYPEIRKYWNKPYRQFSAQQQLRYNPGGHTLLKTYFTYDKTKFGLFDLSPFNSDAGQSRAMNYDEDNLYMNTTFRTATGNGYKLFAGMAYAKNNRRIDNSLVIHDKYKNKEQELHLKVKAGKRVNELYRYDFGGESIIRTLDFSYRDIALFNTDFKHHISGIYLSNDFNPGRNLFVNASSRLEYSSLNDKYDILPRVALNYKWSKVNLSAVWGMYRQNVDNELLIYDKSLLPEKNSQVLLSAYYREQSRIYRLELYHKQYKNLAERVNNATLTDRESKSESNASSHWGQYTIFSDGKGYSRGVDLFFNDIKFMKYWEYMIAYSYNDSEREYRQYKEKTVPSFVTKHNASVTLKYSNFKVKSIIGVTNRFASGRTYHDPNKAGVMNEITPYYNSLDISYTYLAHKKFLIYASFSNLLNRDNIYGYTYSSVKNPQGIFDRIPVKSQHNQTFYIGIFITLGKNVAYESTHF